MLNLLLLVVFIVGANAHSQMICAAYDPQTRVCRVPIRTEEASLTYEEYRFDGINPCQPVGRGGLKFFLAFDCYPEHI
jgi:hypothetical protein